MSSRPSFTSYAKELFEKLNNLPDHIDFEDNENELDIGQEFQRSEFEADVQRLLSDEDLNFSMNNDMSTTRISDIEFTPIRNMVNEREKENLLPDVEFPDVEDAANLVEASFAVEMVKDKACYSESSVKLFKYAERAYFMFLKRMDEQFPDFSSIQRYPYPLQRNTFLMFLYWCRVTKDYCFSTVSGTFCYGFLNYLHISKKSVDFRKNEQFEIQAMLRSLLRKFGHQTFKVEPLLNPEWYKLRKHCNIQREDGARLNALLAVSRARGLRGVSLNAMRLKHLTWIKTIVDDRICITLTMKIIKEKKLLDSFWPQTLPGFLNLNKCPNVALLVYLADIRGVFTAGSAAQCIISGDFSLKENMSERPVFCALGHEFVPMTNQDMSSSMKNLSREIIEKSITTRSCRSGLVVSTLLVDTIRNNGMHDERTLQTLVKFVGWKNIDSLTPYDRWVTNHFSAINYFQEGDEGENAMAVVKSLAVEKGFLCGDEFDSTSIINTVDLNEEQLNSTIKEGYAEDEKWAPNVRRLALPQQGLIS